MLKKEERLNKNQNIRKVIEKGFSFKTPLFIVKYTTSDKLRIAIVVSKKISKSAVGRNRIKRIFRAGIKNVIKNNDVKGNLVFFPHMSTLSLKSTDLKQSLESIFKEIKKKKWKNY